MENNPMEKMLRDITAVITTEVNPEAIVLFGSYATGQVHPDSDIDLLVIETHPFDRGRSRRKEMTRLWRALARFQAPKDILVYSRSEVEKWRDARNHVIARALREGRTLYGKP